MSKVNSWSKGKVVSYVLFFAALFVVLLQAAGVLQEDLMVVIVGFLGFGGIAALRSFIASSGVKTYLSLIIGVVGVVVHVFFPDFLSLDELVKWLTLWGSAAGAGLTAGIVKAQNNS